MGDSVATRLLLALPKRETCDPRGGTPAPDKPDEDLLGLVTEGNREALALLFYRYAHVIRVVAHRVLRDASEAEDLLQDIFIQIHRLCETFDSSKGSARLWILQMAYRRAISRRRYLNSRHFYTRVELNDHAIEAVEPRSGEFDAANSSMLAGLDLQKVFATLSKDQQRTLRLHFIEGYTLDEIAKMLGQTKGNVRHHSFRGLERLRKLIFAGKLPVREQYDTGIVQPGSKGGVSKRTP